MTPKQNALAFRIWRHAQPLGWDCTAADVAEAISTTPQRVGSICRSKGWTSRLRSTDRDGTNPALVRSAGFITMLDVDAGAGADVPRRHRLLAEESAS